MGKVWWLSFYRWGNQGTETWSYSLGITQPVRRGAGGTPRGGPCSLDALSPTMWHIGSQSRLQLGRICDRKGPAMSMSEEACPPRWTRRPAQSSRTWWTQWEVAALGCFHSVVLLLIQVTPILLKLHKDLCSPYVLMPHALFNSCCCCLVFNLCPTLLWSLGLSLAKLLCPWNSPGINTGMGYHFLLLGIFPTQGLNLYFLHWQADFLLLSHPGRLFNSWIYSVILFWINECVFFCCCFN